MRIDSFQSRISGSASFSGRAARLAAVASLVARGAQSGSWHSLAKEKQGFNCKLRHLLWVRARQKPKEKDGVHRKRKLD